MRFAGLPRFALSSIRTADALDLAQPPMRERTRAKEFAGTPTMPTEPPFVEHSSSVGWDVGLGLGYGFVVWLVAMAIVMPIRLGAIGAVETLPSPWLDPMPLMAHLLYGLVVGVVYPLVEFE